MGWLTGAELSAERERGRIVISPFSSSLVNPNSYNYTLGNVVRRLTSPLIDLRGVEEYEEHCMGDEGMLLLPGECYLCHTSEIFGSRYYASLVTGRSSVGRKFITNHITAGLVDLGFFGQITLEVTVQRPTMVYPGVPFGQIFWFRVQGDRSIQYQGKYQSQEGPVQSRLSWDLESMPLP